MVLGFIQYSREAFGALWEHLAGEVAATEKLWTPHRPHPELISARMVAGETDEYCRRMEEFRERPGDDKKGNACCVSNSDYLSSATYWVSMCELDEHKQTSYMYTHIYNICIL